MSQKMEYPKNLGDAWKVYKKFGFTDNEITLNATILVGIHNKHLSDLSDKNGELEMVNAQLTKEREDKHKMQGVLKWYADDINCNQGSWNDGAFTSRMDEDGGKRAREILEALGGNDTQ